MISGALCPTHGSSDLLFIQVTSHDNDVVNEMPVFGPGMYQRSLLQSTEMEDGACDDKTQLTPKGK